MSPALKRGLIALPFLLTIGLVRRSNEASARSIADAARPAFQLRDETARSGIGFVHRTAVLDPRLANVEPHIVALGAGVSVADVDGDGWQDLYFTNSRFGAPNALYRNRGDGSFEDVAASAGVADLNQPGAGVSMGSVWGDFDNDGREDLLVYRYGHLALLKNVDGRRFTDVTDAAGLRRWVNSNGAIWLDYDRDGLLDLYVTAYFRDDVDLWRVKTTRIMHNSFEFATNGGKNLLFRNVGGGKFEDVTDRAGVGSTRWTLAAASADFNGDGWPDIYLANDYGPEELFLNEGRQEDSSSRPRGSRANPRAGCRWRWATSTIAAGSTCSSRTSRRAGTCFRTTTFASTSSPRKRSSATWPTPPSRTRVGRGARSSAT